MRTRYQSISLLPKHNSFNLHFERKRCHCKALSQDFAKKQEHLQTSVPPESSLSPPTRCVPISPRLSFELPAAATVLRRCWRRTVWRGRGEPADSHWYGPNRAHRRVPTRCNVAPSVAAAQLVCLVKCRPKVYWKRNRYALIQPVNGRVHEILIRALAFLCCKLLFKKKILGRRI